MQDLLVQALWLYTIVIFARIVLSWFPLAPGSPMTTVYNFTRSLTDPVLEPIRRLLPSVGMFDFSPLVLILGITILQRAIANA